MKGFGSGRWAAVGEGVGSGGVGGGGNIMVHSLLRLSVEDLW
jgi:hypothetical protein